MLDRNNYKLLQSILRMYFIIKAVLNITVQDMLKKKKKKEFTITN